MPATGRLLCATPAGVLRSNEGQVWETVLQGYSSYSLTRAIAVDTGTILAGGRSLLASTDQGDSILS